MPLQGARIEGVDGWLVQITDVCRGNLLDDFALAAVASGPLRVNEDEQRRESSRAAESATKRFRLPMRAIYPILAGVFAGLLLRLAFSGPGGSSWSAMAGAFIFLTPMVVGMVTVYLAERQYRRSWSYYFLAPLLANCLFVLGMLLLLIEGLICAVIIVPMFAVLGGIGGLLMGAICRATNWPTPTLYGFAALPLLLGWLGGSYPEEAEFGQIERSVMIAAPVAQVWQQLNHIEDISGPEMERTLAAQIGVPMPMSGVTEQRGSERVRVSRWGKQVYFEEVIEDWEFERQMRWRYRFFEDSFPRAALDDHVVIGGHYFDLIDTSYSLAEVDGETRLTTQVRYRITTQFNFYADWVAQLLLGNLSEHGLALYKQRSEAGAKLSEQGTR